MKKRFKYAGKLVVLALAGTMMFAGCNSADEAANSNYTLVQNQNEGEFKITEEPIELTLFYARTDSKKQEDLAIWKEIAKLTNVSLKTVNSVNVSDRTQAFNIMMASGDIPDLTVYDDGIKSGTEYGMKGAFAKIDELINDDTPNLKREFERPVVKNKITAPDGHIYYIPGLNPEGIAARGWFVRQDWLDKLGLDTPTNTEEYYEVLKAFREQDPNGNGQQDEIPYFSRFNTSGVADLLSLWNVREQWDIKDGKVVYTPSTKEYVEAYGNIQKWYAEGLIDKEIYTRGGKARDKLLGDNVGGSTHDWFGSTAQFNDMLKDSVPGINMVPIIPPNGKEYYLRDVVTDAGIMISENSDKKEVAIRFVDFIFSETGSRFSNFGIEGVHYDMKDGKPYYKDYVIHGDKTAINILNEAGACSQFSYINDFWYEEQWLTPVAREGMQLYQNGYLAEAFPTLAYTSEEKDEFNSLLTAIKTYVDETTQKWVFGTGNPTQDYDSYLQQLKTLGVDRLVEIQQVAYDRYTAK